MNEGRGGVVLVLSVIRCPDQAVPEQRRVPGGEYVLGRGAECDWVLKDPDRVLSKRHCAVEFLGGGWQVRDLSTNGTYLNSGGDPVGRDRTGQLQDGDRLRLGAYEIECRVEDEAVHGSGRWQSARAIPEPMMPPPATDIFSVPLPGLSPAGGTPGGHAALLPSDFDPFAAEDPGPAMPDHRPSTSDVFTPPRATMPDLLPEDWGAAPKVAPPANVLPDPFADAPPRSAGGFAPLPEPSAPAPPRAQPAVPPDDPFVSMPPPGQSAAPLPDPFAAAPLPDPFATPPLAAMSPPAQLAPEPLIQPRQPPAASPGPFAEADTPVPPPALNVAPPQVTADGLDGALALLFQSAGLGAPPPGTDAAAALTAAGAVLRASVAGIRALLIARADVKREFRIEQTMIRHGPNNPVKFAHNDDEAIRALLSPQGRGPAALRETVQDLTAHQVATLAATQAAARALLMRLAPGPLEADTPSGGIMPGAREKALWAAYKKTHQQVLDQFEDDFDSAFGKAFARAYEEAARSG